MALIQKVETGFYRIPLPLTLSDSTHGEITSFELITVRLGDSDGAEGVGYTYTVGRNGGSIAYILRPEIPELIESQQRPMTRKRFGSAPGGRCIMADVVGHPFWHCRPLTSRCGI